MLQNECFQNHYFGEWEFWGENIFTNKEIVTFVKSFAFLNVLNRFGEIDSCVVQPCYIWRETRGQKLCSETRSNMLFHSCFFSWWERCEDQHNLRYFWSEPGWTSSHLFASDVWETNTVWGKRLWLSGRVMAFLYLSGNRLDFQ